MGLFSDITSAIGSVGNALFGSSNNNSNNNSDNPLKKNQNKGFSLPQSNLVSQKINTPTPIVAPKPLIPLVAPQSNAANLTAQPIHPTMIGANPSVSAPSTLIHANPNSAHPIFQTPNITVAGAPQTQSVASTQPLPINTNSNPNPGGSFIGRVADDVTSAWQHINPFSGVHQANQIISKAQNQYGLTPQFIQTLHNANTSITNKPLTTADAWNGASGGAQAVSAFPNTNPGAVNRIEINQNTANKSGQATDDVVHEGLHQVWYANPQLHPQFIQAFNAGATPQMKSALVHNLVGITGFKASQLDNLAKAPALTQDEVHSSVPAYFSAVGANPNNPLTKYYSQFMNPNQAYQQVQQEQNGAANPEPGIQVGGQPNNTFRGNRATVPTVPGAHVTGAQTAEDLAGIPAGVALGALRMGEGAVTGLTSLPDQGFHLGAYIGSKLTGKPEISTKGFDNVTKTINAPVNWLAQKTDQAAQAYGPGAQNIYKPAQIAAGVATAIPAVESLAGKAGDIVNALKGNVPSEVSDLVNNTRTTSLVDKNLDETPPAALENAPPETGTKGPQEPAPTNAPSGEPTKTVTNPSAPESGVKPVTPPTPNVTNKINALPLSPESTPTPPEASPAPADIQTEQAAVQNAVDKTAQDVPQPTAPPVAAAPAETPAQAASDALAAKEAPVQQVVANEVPDYTSPHKNGKASVPGNSAARYSTGDSNLDGIVNDSIIAHKGTAATAGTRADALDQAGIDAKQRAQIRNIATKNVDKATGKISATGVKQIEDVLKGPTETPKAATVEAPAKAVEPTTESTVPFKGPTTLKETGDPMKDLDNVTQKIHDEVENGIANPEDIKNSKELSGKYQSLTQWSRKLNDQFGKLLDKVLTKNQQANVLTAIQEGKVDGLTGDEKQVANILQEHLTSPADVLRGNVDKNYVKGDNYFTQMRKGVSGGAKRATKTVGDLLSNKSHFSESRTAGKFTSGNDVKYGDAKDLGLYAKKDGTYVNKAGKVYDFSHASNQELADNAGMKFHGLSTSAKVYGEDTMNLKYRTQLADEVAKNPEKYNLSERATENNQPSVTLKGSDGENKEYFTDKATQKDFDDSGLNNRGKSAAGIGTKLWNKAQSLVLQSTIQNPFWHGLGNQGVQGMIVSGERAKGLGGLQFLADNPDLDVTERMLKAGGNLPSMGKDAPGLLSKLTYGGSKTNARVTAWLDNNMRLKAFDSLTKNGMTDKAAAEKVNQFLGGHNIVSDMQPHLDFFWHYYSTMVKALGHTVADTTKGHPGVLINAAIASGTIYALDKAWQKATGNTGANIHPFGEVGTAASLVNSLRDLAKHEYANAATTVTDRVSPLVSQLAEQVLGVNSYGEKFQNGSQRVQNLSQLSPAVGAFMSTGKSDAEKGLNYLGINTPHVKGDMATNNKTLAPILNTKGAKSGVSPGFPNDFTGEQSAKQYYAGVDKSLQGLSSHDADVLNTYYNTQVNQNGQRVATGTTGGYANAVSLVLNDDRGGQALKHLYDSQHGQTGNAPLWNLPLYAPVGQPSVKNYLLIQSEPEGYEKDGAIQKYQGSPVATNGWYDKLQAQNNKYYSQFPPSKDAKAEPPYPVFDKQTTADINAADNITDPTKFSQYLDANPDVVSAFAATANWTNQIRAIEGKPTQEPAVTPTPEVAQTIKTYDALPASKTAGNTDTATSGERSAWIKANPDAYNQMIQYFAQSDMRGVIENSIKAEYSGQGVNDQSLLKDTKGAGSDIVTNPNGTDSLNAPAASAAAYGSGSGSSYTSPSTLAYDRDKAAGISDDTGLKTVINTKSEKGLKADITKKYKAPKLLVDKAPTGKNGNPLAQVISYTGGVKSDKGSNPFGNKISAVVGSKAV